MNANNTSPGTLHYWRNLSRSSPHRDWHTFYALADWTAVEIHHP